MKKRTLEKKRAPKNGILTSALFGLCISTLTLISIIAIFSCIGLAMEKPHSLLSPISLFAIYASAFLGGFASVKKNKGRDSLICGLICGSITALFFSLIFWILALAFDSNNTPVSWLFRVLIAVASIVGALLGTTKVKKMPKRRRRR